ncbi:MAG TPA: hypothetical protein VLV54_17070 [Thermoanaerobaculia bacterium]|nr:hypothetical protein [Thermoanaerobaculia bacterium]
MRNAPLWLVLLLGLVVGVPAGRLAMRAPEKTAPASVPAPAPSPTPATSPSSPASEVVFTCKGTVTSPPPSWCEPVRLLGDFLGRPLRANAARDELAADLAQAAQAADYDLHFLVALVPAPPDPRLDQALEAVQRAFAQSDYLADRVWLPWTGEGANRVGGAVQTAPGLFLFRRRESAGSPRSNSLFLVFLVGETPKAGIQKPAFREALKLASGLQSGASDPTVALLGPSFSGSVESLRLSLHWWKQWEGEQQGRPPLSFLAATGSATASAKDIEGPLKAEGVDLCRAVLPDETLHELTLDFLRDSMGWNLGQVALLVEADTAYGRSLLDSEKVSRKLPRYGPAPHSPLVVVPFPSHISELRTAAEKEKAAQAKAAAGTQPRIPTQSTALELDLTEPGQPDDLVPTFDSLTVLSNQLVLEDLLQAISREGIRYVGILATDVKDKLFLAEQVRSRVPDALLFTLNNDLLFAHPQYSQTLDGMLVFSSAPLLTEGSPWQPVSLSPVPGRMRRKFSSEFQQGIYEAVRYLLGEKVVRPRAWIMAVGNGSLWPVARLKVTLPPEPVLLCGEEPPMPGPVEGNGFTGRDDLQILLVALLLAVFAWRLDRAALLERVAGDHLEHYSGTRILLVAGTALLAVTAGVLLAVGSIPAWARGISLDGQAVHWQWMQIAYLAALGLVYALLVRAVSRAAHSRVTRSLAVVWSLGGVVALAVIAGGLRWLCIPGDQVELFHLRARAFSSGLSPLVALAAVGWAVYVWILWELLRRRLMARQSTDCPVETLGDAATFGCAPALKKIHGLLVHTLPTDRRLWLLPALAFLPPVSLLWSTVQPVAETKNFGRFFILFLVVALALSALSFFRFFRLWVWTLRILHRLDNASPRVADAFQAVAKDLDWRPIQSFGWQIPAFKTLTLSVRRLKALAAAGKVKLPDGTAPLDAATKEIFENGTDAGSPQEIAARNQLETIFGKVCVDLQGHCSDPEVRQFVAMRVAAWLRYIFAHMRSCLIGGLASGLLALVGVTAYSFQPRHFVSLAIWLALAVAVGLTMMVFVQMDRNPTLSRIGDTTPGKVTFDLPFFSKLFTFVGLPLLGLIATQFPEVGHLLGGIAGQLLRIAGGG